MGGRTSGGHSDRRVRARSVVPPLWLRPTTAATTHATASAQSSARRSGARRSGATGTRAPEHADAAQLPRPGRPRRRSERVLRRHRASATTRRAAQVRPSAELRVARSTAATLPSRSPGKHRTSEMSATACWHPVASPEQGLNSARHELKIGPKPPLSGSPRAKNSPCSWSERPSPRAEGGCEVGDASRGCGLPPRRRGGRAGLRASPRAAASTSEEEATRLPWHTHGALFTMCR